MAWTITGTAKRDVLDGGKGADRLAGDRGGDRLYGGAGNDRRPARRWLASPR